MRRRTGRRGRKVVLEYSLFACGRRGSFSLFPCFRIRVGGVIYVCGRVSGGGVRFACRQNQKMFTDVDAGDAEPRANSHTPHAPVLGAPQRALDPKLGGIMVETCGQLSTCRHRYPPMEALAHAA